MTTESTLRASARKVARSLEVLVVGMSPEAAEQFKRHIRRKRNRLLRDEKRGGVEENNTAPAPYTTFKRAARKHWVDHWVKQHPPSSPDGEQLKPSFKDYGTVMMPQLGELWRKEKNAQGTEHLYSTNGVHVGRYGELCLRLRVEGFVLRYMRAARQTCPPNVAPPVNVVVAMRSGTKEVGCAKHMLVTPQQTTTVKRRPHVSKLVCCCQKEVPSVDNDSNVTWFTKHCFLARCCHHVSQRHIAVE